MKTYISDLIPKLQRFSQRLDNNSLLTNQHWVAIDDIGNNKNVYIFRTNNDLLISQNGKIEKAKWEYLGNNSLLIEKKNESYLFKHGFFDENILALKVDSKEEYAFLINENKYNGELNSIERVIDFLNKRYIEPKIKQNIIDTTNFDIEKLNKRIETKIFLMSYRTNKGILEVEQSHNLYPKIHKRSNAYISGEKAPDGKYKLGFLWYVYVKNGKIKRVSLL